MPRTSRPTSPRMVRPRPTTSQIQRTGRRAPRVSVSSSCDQKKIAPMTMATTGRITSAWTSRPALPSHRAPATARAATPSRVMTTAWLPLRSQVRRLARSTWCRGAGRRRAGCELAAGDWRPGAWRGRRGRRPGRRRRPRASSPRGRRRRRARRRRGCVVRTSAIRTAVTGTPRWSASPAATPAMTLPCRWRTSGGRGVARHDGPRRGPAPFSYAVCTVPSSPTRGG